MGNGTIELTLLVFAFLGLQVYWIRMTIKNGRTGEIDKWGRKLESKQEYEIENKKELLEKIFRS